MNNGQTYSPADRLLCARFGAVDLAKFPQSRASQEKFVLDWLRPGAFRTMGRSMTSAGGWSADTLQDRWGSLVDCNEGILTTRART